MAIIRHDFKELRVINVAVVSSDSHAEVALLEQQQDMSVSIIAPGTIDTVIKTLSKQKPDIVVIDQHMQSISADLLCHFISQNFTDCHCLMLIDDQPTFEMLQNSGFKARGYVTNQQRELLDKAIRVVFDGEAWLPRKLVTEMLDRFAASLYSPDKPQANFQ